MPRRLKNFITRVQELLKYDEETGHLYWKFPMRGKAKFGQPAGTIGGNGYKYISVDGNRIKNTHAIWIIKKGRFPFGVIDHINRDCLDERWENLRDIEQADNIRNGKIRKDNNTGSKGITLQKNGRYKTRKDGKHIGVFDSLEEAKAVYASQT